MPEDPGTAIEPAAPTPSPLIPVGDTSIHRHVQSGQIWKLCCRIRLDMRESGLTIKDAKEALLLAYPDLKISQRELTRFMEDYVDTAIVVDQSFWKKGLMRAKAQLNAVAELSEVAQRMQDAWEASQPDVTKHVGTYDRKGQPVMKVPLKDFIAAGEKVAKIRKLQAEEMAKVGFGPAKEVQEKAKPVVNIPMQANVTVNLGDALGGSFRRTPAVDVEGKEKGEAQPA